MFFERRCPGCGDRSAALCPGCRRSVAVPLPPRAPAGLDSLRAWCRYEGAGRSLVLALKHGGRRDLARWLAGELAPLATGGAVVTWVPASRDGRRDRGYDQGAVLARALARRLGLPAAALLGRPAGSASQRGRDRAARLEGSQLRARRRVRGPVLVVDDVITTGASLSGGALALRQAGAGAVHGLVVAVADRDLGPWTPPGARP